MRLGILTLAITLAALTVLVVSAPASNAATTDMAVAFGSAAGNAGSWTTSYTLSVNWNGSTGQRPVAIATANVAVTAGHSINGPTFTNSASAQTSSGGSLMLLAGNAFVHSVLPAAYQHGVTGGSAVTIARPAHMAAGDLAVVYINTANTMTAPAGWTKQRTDGPGTFWTRAYASLPTNLGTWRTTDAHGWTYTAVAFVGSCTPIIDGVGGSGTLHSTLVTTGSAVAKGGSCGAASTATSTSTPTAAANTSTPTPTQVASSNTNTPTSTSTPTPTSTTIPPTSTSVPTGSVPTGEDRCNNASLASVDVKANFGATGNGTTDDHAAFVNAIATGKVVHVPAGTYRLSQINLPAESTVVLCGAGQGSTTLIQANSPNATEAMFYQADFSNREHVAYLEIQDMTLDGNKANVERRPQGSSMTNYGMVDVMLRKGLIANDELRNAYHALRIEDVGDQGSTPGELVIRDNWFHGQALEAGFTGGTTHSIHLSKFYTSNSVIWVSHNNVEACGSGTGDSCTPPSSNAGQSAGGLLFIDNCCGTDPLPQQLLRIYDNTFRNVGMNMPGTDEPESPIYLYQQADGAQILRNRILGSVYSGITVFSSNNVEIGGNDLEGNIVPVPVSANYSHMEYYAIDASSRQTNFPTYVSSHGWNIHDNTVANSTWYKKGVCACFNVDGSGNGTGSDILIANNVFRNNINNYVSPTTHMTPIDQEGATGVTLSGNDASQN